MKELSISCSEDEAVLKPGDQNWGPAGSSWSLCPGNGRGGTARHLWRCWCKRGGRCCRKSRAQSRWQSSVPNLLQVHHPHTEFREQATFLQALGGTGDSPAMPSSCPKATVPSAGTAPHPHPPHPHTPPQSEDSPAGSQARSSRGRKALSSRVLMSPSSGSSPESLPVLGAEGLGPRLFLRHRGGCSAPLTRAVQAVPLAHQGLPSPQFPHFRLTLSPLFAA